MLKTVGNFAGRKTLRRSVGYELTLSDKKRRTLSPRVDEKDIFKVLGNFSEFIYNPSKIFRSANIRGISVSLSCYVMKTICQLKCVEKVHVRKLYGKNCDFIFFLQKYA